VVGARGVEAGGISGLVALLERDGEAIDAELQSRYGLSLNDVAAGRLSFRRLRGLLEWLPGDGTALWRKSRRDLEGSQEYKSTPPPDEYWTPERHMLADLIDIGAQLLWAKTEDARRGINRPQPIPRPGVTGEKRYGTPMTATEVLAILRPSPGGDPHGDAEDDTEGTDHSPGDGDTPPVLLPTAGVDDPADGQGQSDEGQEPHTPQQ